MELETLEIFIEANTEKIQAQLEPLMPYFDKVFGNIERITGQSINKTEKKMDVGDGVSNVSKQFEEMKKMYEKNLEMMEKITSSSTDNINKGLTKGFQQSRKTVGKEVDALVKDINAKMGRAKAEQEKLAFLQAQRQDASSKGDTKNVVKYDGQIARAQEMMNKYQSQAKSMADSIKQEFKTLPASLEAMTKEMSKNESVIEGQKSKVKELTALYEQQAKKISKLSTGQLTKLYEKYGSTYDPGYQKEVKQAGFKFEDTKSSKKTGAEITKYNKEIQKLIAKNDMLQQSYSEAEDRTKQLRSAVKGLNTELGKSSMATGNAALGMKKVGKGADDSKGLFSKFGGVFNRTSNNIAHGSRRMAQQTGAFGQSMKYLLPSMIVYQLLGGAIRKLTTGLWSALKANDEFSNSLNQIKVNMLTAFYPIYTTILPAINALMRALTVVTGQIAHFTASLFGTTYTAAKQGASGLYQNIQAMNDSGTAADKNREKVKKLQRSLMGFDEINRIGLDDSSDDKLDNNANKDGVNFNTPNPPMPDWVNKANSILRDFFKPFQDSWAKHGKAVTDSWNYALRQIGGLVHSIGKSFMEVWTNGTGEQFISNILILVSNLLGLVGDVAKAFKNAWDENERGAKLIQSIFNMWNAFLGLTNEIVESFRNAWNETSLGQSILANILEIFTNLLNSVGLLVEGFKNAWKENEIGTSILTTILSAFDGILESINSASSATKVWASNLNFTPLLKSIDGLLKSIKPLTKNIFDGIGWFYTNVLLPLAGFTITDVIPVFFDLLGGAIDIVNSVINTLKPLGKWLWDSFLKPMAEWTGGVIVDVLSGVAKGLKGISDWIDNHAKGFSDFVVVVGTFAATLKAISMLSSLGGILSSAFAGFSAIGGLTGVISGLGSAIGGVVAVLGGPITLAVAGAVAAGALLWKNWDWVQEKAGQLGSWIGEKWDDIKVATKDTWNNVKEKTKETWDNVSTKVKTKTSEAWTNTKTNWDNIKKNTGDNFETVRKWTSEKWSNVKETVTNYSRQTRNNASNAWNEMKNKVNDYNSTIKSNTANAFKKVVENASKLGGNIGKALEKGKKSVESGAKTVANYLKGFPMKAINAIKDGVGWVLEKLNMKNNMGGDYKDTKAYAQGTGYHSGGMALVNDGYGANFREAYRLPNGQTGLFPNQRNLMVDLPAGSSVLSGPRTASMMSGNIPAYANGVGDWFKKQWNGIKKFTGDVWDYATNPGKLVEAGISQTFDLKGALDPMLSISNGVIGSTASAATAFVKNKMEELFDSGDDFNGNASVEGNGVYSYLMSIARNLMKKYGMVFTSGYRSGDPYDHGKGLAVDIAIPGVVNGSPTYRKAADEAIRMPGVKYVITNGMWKHKGQPWVTWPEGDHYDHVHISGNKPSGRMSGDSYSPKGSGVERWRGPIRQAAGKMRQSITPGQVNGILAQIQRESGGNDKIIQNPGVWDINMANGNPARGLLQYIPQTFNAFRVRGFGNIMNGFHQLMAFFNNSNWRNDIQYGNSGWGPRGHRIQPYAKGTPYLPEDQIALLHKGEMVVPADFNPYNNMADFQTLQMPELFREEAKPVEYTYTPDKRDIGGGMNGATEGIVNAVMMALNMRNEGQSQGGDINITLELEGSKVADVVIKEHNKFVNNQGYSPLKI